MDFTLTEDQQAFRDTARQFATARMLPQAARWDAEKIFPEEGEAAIKAHPDVVDAVVVGVPDDRWGQRVAAVIQTREGREITLAAIDAHCRTRVAGYKVPRQLRVVDQIVRHPSGKPDYRWAATIAHIAASMKSMPGRGPRPRPRAPDSHTARSPRPARRFGYGGTRCGPLEA